MISCELRVSRLPVGVGEQQARAVDQRPGDRDALLLAAGQLTRTIELSAVKTKLVKRLSRPRQALGFSRRASGVKQRQGDVLNGARAREQIEALEDKADAFAADAGQHRLAHLRDVEAIEQIFTASRLVEAAKDVHQR
jgi:hypothetical protein